MAVFGGSAFSVKVAYVAYFSRIRGFSGMLRKEQPAFARRRSGVRIPSAPLRKNAVLQEKFAPKWSMLAAGGVLVQQPCSNAEGEVVKGEPLVPALNQLTQFVEGFVKLFPPLFRCMDTP